MLFGKALGRAGDITAFPLHPWPRDNGRFTAHSHLPGSSRYGIVEMGLALTEGAYSRADPPAPR